MNKLKRFYEANRTSNKGRQINESISDDVVRLIQEFEEFVGGYATMSIQPQSRNFAKSSLKSAISGNLKIKFHKNKVMINVGDNRTEIDLLEVQDLGTETNDVFTYIQLYVGSKIGGNNGVIVTLSGSGS